MFLSYLLSLALPLLVTAQLQGLPKPSLDGFYSQPEDLASHAPGQVLRTRQFLSRYPTNVSASYQFFYRSNDDQGGAIGATGAVFIPEVPATEPKLVAYNVAEDAANLDCAPSWVWVNATPTRNTSSNEVYLNWAVSRGYYFVSIDFEGPTGAWLDGKIEGRTVLDGVRAALSFLSLPLSTPWVTAGFSGGAHTAAFASNEYALGYAPDLNLIGATYGGTPIDLTETLQHLDGTLGSQLALYGILGLANAYPSISAAVNAIRTPLGILVFDRLSDLCPSSNDYQITYLGPIEPLFWVQPLSLPATQVAIANNSLLNNVSTVPVSAATFPRFIYHGSTDDEVPYAPATQYVQQQCAQGADIRFVTFPNADHFSSQLDGLVAGLQFMEDVLEARLAPASCGSPIPTPAVGSPEANAYLGPYLAALSVAVEQSG